MSLVNAIEEDEEKGQWSVVGSEQKAELLDIDRNCHKTIHQTPPC